MTRTASRNACAAIALALLVTGGVARAHESRPLYVEITERAAELFEVQWRAPLSVPAFNVPEVVLPEACAPLAPRVTIEDPGAHVRRRLHRCAGGLSGREVEIRYPVLNPSVTTLVRFERASGETHTTLLGPDEASWRVPERETRTGVARDYLGLGAEHILGGYDHLLFVACLLLIARTWRKILITITGFTLAHSITLALAALGLVQVPVPPLEAAIALSIVFVASEIARPARDTLSYRFPIAVSASFGLLHGFGFASVLHEIGLPQLEIPAALLFFNVGVEIGQILFVAALLVAWSALRTIAAMAANGTLMRAVAPGMLERTAAYAAGGLAAFWMIERVGRF
jgi:hypothetical protein